MSRFYRVGLEPNSHIPMWRNSANRYIIEYGIEDAIIRFCRKALGKRYRDYWIDVVYFDDKYWKHTHKFFYEVGIALYPKTINLKDKLKQLGIEPPASEGKTKSQLQYEWEAYSQLVWDLVHEDINSSLAKGIEPMNLHIKGLRYPCKNGSIGEKYLAIDHVPTLDE